MTIDQALTETLRGHAVRVELTEAGGGGEVIGTLAGRIDSADGWVLFVRTKQGTSVSIHNHYVADLTELKSA